MTKEIPLTQNKFALVDDADYDWLMQWKWHAQHNGHNWYAARNQGKRPFRTIVQMHSVIAATPKGFDTDHIDGNGLNNQRDNLRVCTHAENRRNQGKQENNTSGYKGVVWDKGKWRAEITVNRRKIRLGIFGDPEMAARAYDKAAKQYHGTFAKLNFSGQ